MKSKIYFLSVLLLALLFTGCPKNVDVVTENDETTELSGITVDTKKAKLTYSKGDKFSFSGISIKGTYGSKTKTILPGKCTYTINGNKVTNSTVLNETGSYIVVLTFEGFTYSFKIKVTVSNDDYSGIAGWSNKDKWNLANTHDPTVFYWPADDYYYMYTTDASYGNEGQKAPSGKHFQGKRSKDLINWEWVKGPFDECPSWINTKLNEFRTELGLPTVNMTTATNKALIGYWAPCARVITVDGVKKVRMYYDIVADYMIGSGEPNDGNHYDGTWSERAFIGVMETTCTDLKNALTVDANTTNDPALGWVDLGYVLCSSSDLHDGRETPWKRTSSNNWDAYFYFNAIDPTYFIDDDGSHWMIYGSWHSGLAIVQINPKTGKVTKDGVTDFTMGKPWASSPAGLAENGFGTRIYNRGGSRWQGSEGPELVKYNGKYYLFVANDGLDVPYHTRVVVADSITGPYKDITGAVVTNGASGAPLPIVTHPYKFSGQNDSGYGWVGFSHCAIFQDKNNDWFYLSQARFPKDVAGINASNALMMGHVRRIVWVPESTVSSNVWPMVLPERYAGYDKLTAGEISASDIAGNWQTIKLEYKYATMDESVETIFVKTSDNGGTVSGGLSGSWTFDSTKNLLTIGTRVFAVERELDWENSETATLVLTGIGGSSATYWGKKVDSVTLPIKYNKTYTASSTITPLETLISEDTGLSVSFKLKLGSTVTDNTYEWETPVKISDGSNTIYIDVGPLGVWLTSGGENLFESSASKGSSFTQENWQIFCQDGSEQFVTISFNKDGSIVYYKNGKPALTYAAATVVKDSITVADGCKAAINIASSNGITLHATTTKSYTMSNVIIDVGKDATSALALYNDNK